MNQADIKAARLSFAEPLRIAALNDLIQRMRYSYRHTPERCPAGLPEPLPAAAERTAIDAAFAAIEALPLRETVRAMCEPMNGKFPSEDIVQLLTRCLPEGGELERLYRVNTGVPAAR